MMNGEVVGTNDIAVVESFVATEDAFAVDTETGEQVMPDMTRVEVTEAE
jgi:hypothetical protein